MIDESELQACDDTSEFKDIEGELRKIIDESEAQRCEVISECKIDGKILRIIDESESRNYKVISECNAIDGELSMIIEERESRTAEVTSEFDKDEGELWIIDDCESRSSRVTSVPEEFDGELWKIFDESKSSSTALKSDLNEVDGERRIIDESECGSCGVALELEDIKSEILMLFNESALRSADVKSELNEVNEEQRLIDEIESQSCEVDSESIDIDTELWRMIDENGSQSAKVKSELNEVDRELQKMVDESESQTNEATLELNEVDKYLWKDLRNSYTRQCLLSLAEENVCRKLPIGFDLSTVSELENNSNRAPENLKLQGHDPLSTGATTRKSSVRWDVYKLNSIDTGGASGARESYNRRDNFNLSSITTDTGGAFEVTTRESFERDSFKLSSIDSKSTDPGRHNGFHFRRAWQSPGTMGIWDSSSQIPERGGILGSWSSIMPRPSGWEMSTLECQGTKGLLSRCSEPYRPPSFYKAMSHTGMQSLDFCKNETLAFDEGTTKQRETKERRRKDSSELATNRELQTSKEKQKSSKYEDNSKPEEDTCAMVEDLSFSNRNDSPPISPAKYLKDLSNHQPPLQDSEMTCHIEKLQPQILEGRFSALINLEDAENVDPDLIDGFRLSLRQQTIKTNVIGDKFAKKIQPFKTNLAPDDESQGDWRVMLNDVLSHYAQMKGSRSHATSIAKSKENKTRNVFHVNTVEETVVKSSAVEVSGSLGSSVKPTKGTSYLQGVSVSQQQEGVINAAKGLRKSCTALTSGTHQTATAANLTNVLEAEIWQSSHCTKCHDIIMDSRDIHKSRSKFIHWFSGNEKGSKNTSWGEQAGNNIWRASSGTFQKGNFLGQGCSKEASLYDSKPTLSEGTRTGLQECRISWSIERNNCFRSEMPYSSLDGQGSELAEVSRHKDLGDACAEIPNSQITKGSSFNPMFDPGDQADINSEINLPDEDSLITIDDTFIFEQDIPKP